MISFTPMLSNICKYAACKDGANSILSSSSGIFIRSNKSCNISTFNTQSHTSSQKGS